MTPKPHLPILLLLSLCTLSCFGPSDECEELCLYQADCLPLVVGGQFDAQMGTDGYTCEYTRGRENFIRGCEYHCEEVRSEDDDFFEKKICKRIEQLTPRKLMILVYYQE